jgi:hypothetical protein
LTIAPGLGILSPNASDAKLDPNLSEEFNMRKRVLSCSSFLLLAVLIAAPLASATPSFGVKAGLSLSNVNWSYEFGSDKVALRPTFGVFAAFSLSKHLAIQPEVNYLSTGEKATESGMVIYTYTQSFNYLQVPVLVKYSFRPMGKITPVVFAGPAVAFLLSAREKEYLDGTIQYDESIKPYFKSTDFGLDFGLGAEMAVGKMKGLVDLRYYLGLVNVYNRPEPTLTAAVENSMKNNALVVTLGLMF